MKFGPRNRRVWAALWQSPTLMTWGSFSTRVGGLLVLLPLVLTRFSEQEVAVFLLFNVLMGLRNFADLGFSPTFVRFIAYCVGGASSLEEISSGSPKAMGKINWKLLEQVVGAMRRLYRWMALAVLVIYAVPGAFAVAPQIAALPEPSEAWWAWLVVVIGTPTAYWCTQFAAYLQGVNKVALLRRWETLFGVIAILSAAGVLLAGGRLLAVILTQQIWSVLAGFRNLALARNVLGGWWRSCNFRVEVRETLSHVWKPAWRTGVGAGMSLGMVQLTSVAYAQMAPGAELASLLLALRMIAIVVGFSQAPFYSKLPVYARLYSEGSMDRLTLLARRGMRWSYMAFLAGWIGLGVLGPPVFRAIGASTSFPPQALWGFIGLAFLVHRFGAMHIQLYATSNHVVMHIADGVGGAIYLLGLVMLAPWLGIYALPLSQLAAYLSFYCWYAASRSYRLIGTTFLEFERAAALPCLVIGCAYTAVLCLDNGSWVLSG